MEQKVGKDGYSRVREGGEATSYFCIVGTAIRWLLLLLFILTGRLLAATGGPDDCFCRF